jgi:hypothetical protein
MKPNETNKSTAGKGIRGWELSNLDPELFDLRVIEAFGECAECPFLKFCSNPLDSVREMTPKRGETLELGREEHEEGERDVYYALLLEEETRFILLQEHKYCWSDVSYISEEQVPASMLEGLKG